MRIAVALTDYEWFTYLGAHPTTGEINFWTPSPWNLTGLEPGDRYYFLLKSPIRKIGGFGHFVRYTNLTVAEAWDEWKEWNGALNFEEMRRRAGQYRGLGDGLTPETEIGCIVLERTQLLEEGSFVDPQSVGVAFPREVVKVKYFDQDDLFRHVTAGTLRRRWVVYMPRKNLGPRNFDIALVQGIWGAPGEPNLQGIATGDEVVLLHDLRSNETSAPRGCPRLTRGRAIRGTAARAVRVRATSGLRHEPVPHIWDDGEYPWRFNFEVIDSRNDVDVSQYFAERDLNRVRKAAIGAGRAVELTEPLLEELPPDDRSIAMTQAGMVQAARTAWARASLPELFTGGVYRPANETTDRPRPRVVDPDPDAYGRGPGRTHGSRTRWQTAFASCGLHHILLATPTPNATSTGEPAAD